MDFGAHVSYVGCSMSCHCDDKGLLGSDACKQLFIIIVHTNPTSILHVSLSHDKITRRESDCRVRNQNCCVSIRLSKTQKLLNIPQTSTSSRAEKRE